MLFVYTSGQTVSSVLLWHPSECIDLFVIDYVFVLLSEKMMMVMMVI